MDFRSLRVAMTAAFVMMSSMASRADEDVPKPKRQAKPRGEAVAKAKAKAKAKAEADANLVDINSATKEQLKAIPGLTDAYAEKIIAGRPYLSKAHLVTKEVLPLGIYHSIRGRVAARQPGVKR